MQFDSVNPENKVLSPQIYRPIHNIYSFNPNFSDFIEIPVEHSSQNCSFLIDTQADISLIKFSSLREKANFDTRYTVTLRGISSSGIDTFGILSTRLFFNDESILHQLHVTPNSINILSNGILGKDFLKTFNCTIDYDKMSLSFNFNNKHFDIPIHCSPIKDTLVIPPRCEVFRTFKITTNAENLLIPAQEIKKDVFIAGSLADASYPIIRILNITEHTQIISTKNIKSKDLSNYTVCKYNNSTDNDRTEKLTKILKNNIPLFIQDKMLPLCLEYSDIFSVEGDKLTTVNFYEQKIRLSDPTPVYKKNYRLPYSQKEEINNQVDKLLANKLIEPSSSNYNSPVIVVPKKSPTDQKSWRFCVDYKVLNRNIIADKFPLPRIDEILENLGNSQFFSKIDLKTGFWQVPLHEDSRDLTSFSTDKGSFRWKVLPFGLNIGPNSFSRMMSSAFSGLEPHLAFLYIDDVILLGRTEYSHLQNIRKVFEIFRKTNMKINPSKCSFFRHEILFLGHKCTAEGIFPDERKNKVIKDWPIPENKKQTKSFVAFANYYRCFIPNFAKITRPLNELTRLQTTFKWTEECQLAFNKLKNYLLDPQVLAYPDLTKQFIVTTDASKTGYGAILSQIINNVERPISFMSKSFSKGEQNKSTIEQELLAVYYSINHFKPYIFGTHFIVRSDHRPLVYLFNLKDPTSKLSRIRADLDESYSFTIEYIKGKTNILADALSRITLEEIKEITNTATDEKTVFITTRAMSKNKQNENENKQKEEEQNKKAQKQVKNTNENIQRPKIIEEIERKFTKKAPRVKIKIINKNDNEIKIEINVHKGNKIYN